MLDRAGDAMRSPWLAVVGDIVVSHEPKHSDQRLAELLHEAQTAFGNLETPLTTRGVPAEKAFVHRSHPDRADDVKRLGLDVVTLANNHALDYGAQGLEDTVAAVAEAGMDAVGAGPDNGTARRPLLRTTHSGTVALIGLCAALPPGFAATPDSAGVAPLRVLQQVSVDPALVTEQPGMAPFVHTQVVDDDLRAACDVVTAARRDADLVVVGIHWGVPHGFTPASYGVLAEYQRPTGRALVDAGADLVIGHHPHEVHPVEVYGGGLIAYSVGNYLFHSWSALSTSASGTAEFAMRVPAAPYQNAFGSDVTKDSVVVVVSPPVDGQLVVRFVPTTMTDGEPVLASPTRAAATLDRLAAPLPSRADSRTPSVTYRDDLLPDTTISEVRLDHRA